MEDIITYKQMNEKTLEKIIEDNRKSKFFIEGIKAREYYNNNSDINKKERYVIGKNGKEKTKILCNSKMEHNFLYKLIKQKRSFLLSKPYTINAPDNISEYIKISNKTTETIKNVSTDAMLYGIGWMQKYYDENGTLQVKKIPALEVIPIWSDSEHTELQALIRDYTILEYNDEGIAENKRKVEFYDIDGVWRYSYDEEKGLVPENGENKPEPHFYAKVENEDEKGEKVVNEEGMLFNDIPFICIKYNSDEIPLLSLIKSGIDEYNNKTSLLSDMLQDVIDNILVFKGYSVQNQTRAEEILHNLNTLRAVFLDSEGEANNIHNDINTEAFESFLKCTKEDIYDMGMCVNTQAENLRSASGIALKLRYSDLVLDCTEFGTEVEKAIKKIIIAKLEDIVSGGDNLGDYNIDDIKVVFNMDLPTDETEIISNAKNSIGIISDRTIRANHPWVTDEENEQEQIKLENEEKEEEFESYNDEKLD